MTDRKILHALAIAGCIAFAVGPAAAKDPEAEAVFKAMSDFLAAQTTLSVDFDATTEIVTVDMMKVGFASSGSLSLARPDKVRMTRAGGLADVELVFDGAELSAYGRNAKIFGRQAMAGSTDQLIDTLRSEFGLELPAADLLSSNPYDMMMSNVIDSRALGEGVIRGQKCDHVVFRTADVDWQIWVAQGSKPTPCRFTITSKMTVHSPSYTIDFSGWKFDQEVAADDFRLKPEADAKEVAFTELRGLDEVPSPLTEGDTQ